MAKSQQAQVKAVNKHRKTSLGYKIEDKVWLSIRNIYTEKPLKKLDHKRISLYKVIELVGSSYQQELSTSMQVHNVFYPNLLQLASKNPLPGRYSDFLPLVTVVNDEGK